METRFLLLYLLLTLTSTFAMDSYQRGDKVEVFVNKVGPYFNPHETYHYYSLPVCRPDKIQHKSLTLGEVLDGDRMAYSMYEINFLKDVENKLLCKVHLEEKELQQLKVNLELLKFLYNFLGNFDFCKSFSFCNKG